jgi:hypothetical protein
VTRVTEGCWIIGVDKTQIAHLSYPNHGNTIASALCELGSGATDVGAGARRLGLRWSPCPRGQADQPSSGRALAGGDQVLADDGPVVEQLAESRETNDPICAMAAVTLAFDSNTDRCRTVMSPWVWIERRVNKVLCAAPCWLRCCHTTSLVTTMSRSPSRSLARPGGISMTDDRGGQAVEGRSQDGGPVVAGSSEPSWPHPGWPGCVLARGAWLNRGRPPQRRAREADHSTAR